MKISIKNANDVVVRKLNGTNRPGMNRVYWDLQAEAPQKVGNPHELTEFMPAGTYQVTVTHGEESATVDLEVLPRAAEATSGE